jgi:hypothetical protein
MTDLGIIHNVKLGFGILGQHDFISSLHIACIRDTIIRNPVRRPKNASKSTLR